MNPEDPMFATGDWKLERFRAMEREHIARNQWYLGEKAGRPVPWNEAVWDWACRWREQWLQELRASGEYPFD